MPFGEEKLKGWQLAVETAVNSGDPLLQKIAPKVTKGLLGKQVNLLVADSAAKPNDAVGGADLHQPEQDRADDRLDLQCCRSRAQ